MWNRARWFAVEVEQRQQKLKAFSDATPVLDSVAAARQWVKRQLELGY